MTDRELLELAAKAAGIKYTIKDGLFVAHGNKNKPPIPWNPLDDDAEAFRLAVKLWLTIQVDDEDRRTYVVGSTGRCIGTEPHGDDPYAATRRAIVRAAAEIGRAM